MSADNKKEPSSDIISTSDQEPEDVISNNRPSEDLRDNSIRFLSLNNPAFWGTLLIVCLLLSTVLSLFVLEPIVDKAAVIVGDARDKCQYLSFPDPGVGGAKAAFIILMLFTLLVSIAYSVSRLVQNFNAVIAIWAVISYIMLIILVPELFSGKPLFIWGGRDAAWLVFFSVIFILAYTFAYALLSYLVELVNYLIDKKKKKSASQDIKMLAGFATVILPVIAFMLIVFVNVVIISPNIQDGSCTV